MNMPSAMRIIGRAHWYYQRHLKARLPARWRQALSHAARSKVMSISNEFEGLLPQGLQSRPSPLNH